MTIDPQEIWQLVKGPMTSFGLDIIAAIAIFIIGRWIARFLASALKKVMHRNEVEDTLEVFIGNIVYMGLMISVVLAAITQIGVQTTSIIAVIGAAGLAVGLALQGSLSNFASGVLIILFKPYKVGDYVEAAGVGGTVEGVQIFTTVLLTPDNKRVVVPNSQITNSVITNFSANDTRRLDLVFGVSYSDDLDKVHATLASIIKDNEFVLTEPAPLIAVHTLADSSVNFVVRPWVTTDNYWKAHFAITETVKKRFDAEGISIPFPQQDVHIHQSSQ